MFFARVIDGFADPAQCGRLTMDQTTWVSSAEKPQGEIDEKVNQQLLAINQLYTEF